MCGEMFLADIQIRDTSKIAECRMRNENSEIPAYRQAGAIRNPKWSGEEP